MGHWQNRRSRSHPFFKTRTNSHQYCLNRSHYLVLQALQKMMQVWVAAFEGKVCSSCERLWDTPYIVHFEFDMHTTNVCDDFDNYEHMQHSTSHYSHCTRSHCHTNYDKIKHMFESQHWPGHNHNNIVVWACDIPSGIILQWTKTPSHFPSISSVPTPTHSLQTQTQSQAHQTKTGVIPLMITHDQCHWHLPLLKMGVPALWL